jgi:monoamine oxidase
MPEFDAIGSVESIVWSHQPWALGSYSAMRVGSQPPSNVFDRAWGRIVFAGEHTNVSGTMDGAVASGRRAAQLILGEEIPHG